MSDPKNEAMPADAELEAPSAEKEPGEEPKAPEAVKKDQPAPSHHAVGIGIVED